MVHSARGAVLSYADKKVPNTTRYARMHKFRQANRLSLTLWLLGRHLRIGSGEALTGKSIVTADRIVPSYPDFQPPSPKYPSRPLRVSFTLRNRVVTYGQILKMIP